MSPRELGSSLLLKTVPGKGQYKSLTAFPRCGPSLPMDIKSLCPTPDSPASQLSLSLSDTWSCLANTVAFGSWRKAKVNVEEQVTFRSWNLLVRAGGAFCCVGGEVPLSWSPWFSSLLKLGAGDVYALRIFLPPPPSC